MPAEVKSVKELFLAAAALPSTERPAFLADACGPDPGLLAAVERLLAAHERPDSLLDPVPPGGLPHEYHKPFGQAGTIVGGRYKLVELIGEGGMGEVWVAQQTEPVQRAVAVKLIKPGMDSKLVQARFEAERQALALMDHPNIARVLDAGTTPEGRPFFVMELVKGVPITQFCDTHKLTPRQRLELFISLCWAVQHAHQKGIIHRDLKPTNVLVALYDDQPVPKVIDFGVVKATGQPLTDKTLMTSFGAVIGTPEYMSPEQATFNALDVDTRTDVYALGVLLYELLTGTTPLAKKTLHTVGILEMLRLVREQDPPRPSIKLSTAETLPAIAAARNTEPRKLANLVRGELDWIVMKALEKDRNRRYPTANGLAMDVERYLAGEPVRAVPPSAAYRARKFVHRNRGPVAAAALILLALFGGVISTAIGLVQAEAARELADEQRREALEQAEKARTAERRAADERNQANQARERAEAQSAAAEALAMFFHYDILHQADVNRQAEWREVLDPDLSVREVLDRAAAKIDTQTDLTRRAESLIRWAIGDAYISLGQPGKAVPHLDRAWRLHVADPEFGPDHSDSIVGMFKLVEAYRAGGRFDLALPLARQGLELALALHTREPDHKQQPLLGMNHLALTQLEAGEISAAVRRLEEAERWAAANYPPGRAYTRFNLAQAYRAAGRVDDARAILAELLDEAVKIDDLWAARCQAALGQVLLDLHEWAAAEEVIRDCMETRQRREPKSWTTFQTASLLGEALRRDGRLTEAEPLLRDGYREMKSRETTIPPRLKSALGAAAGRLADLYAARGDVAEVAKWRAEQERYPPAKK
jgi:eukaryotic-like serine/threonine-protein kinase